MSAVRGVVCLFAAVAVAGSSWASIVLKMDVDELTSRSDVVVVGTVLGSASRWNAGRDLIRTFTRIRVERVAKGETAAGRVVVVREIGGSVDGYEQETIGGPKFRAGDRVLVFLERAKDGAPGVYMTQGLSYGMFYVSRDAATGREVAVHAAHDLEMAGARPTLFDRGPADLEALVDAVRLEAGRRGR
jgi:hypothetical protein